MTDFALLSNAAAALFMTGLIWFVQIVHYPLFAQIGEPAFTAYEQAHTRLTTFVVGPVMVIEALAAITLLALSPRPVVLLSAILLLTVWLSTALLQVPQHNRLAQGFDAGAHRFLVLTNWIRTVGWTVRAVLSLYMLSGRA
ncbi:MAG: hypothetical protein JNN08_18145 [Bryobacterales bacterium]|nr:hypothetical protein [Bryobacterales bacterium]